MSVENTHYLFWGIRIPTETVIKMVEDSGNEDYFYDLKQQEGGLGFDFILDFMGDEFAFAGHKVDEADDYESFVLTVIDPTTKDFFDNVVVPSLDKIANVREMFPEAGDVKLYLFTETS